MQFSFTRKEVVAVCIVALLVSTSLLGFSLIPSPEKPKYTGYVYILHETVGGVYEIATHNIRTNLGENLARDLLCFNNVSDFNATKWISLSNDASPLVTWTVLPNEVTANGFGRALCTVTAWMNGTDYAANFTATWTATGTQQLQCAGLMYSGQALADNSLYAVASFTQTTFQVSGAGADNLTLLWVLTYDFN